jgi:formylglycine-generating enzyme required for sulfatase activity/dienelactone hydrolase
VELTPGTLLGPYEIVSLLGVGGMGEVYKARDTRLARIVAIKVVSRRLASDRDFRARFDREAHLVSRLNHPNICTLYDVGRQDSLDYLVIEYIEGESLARSLKEGPLPLAQALDVAVQAAHALAHAHQQRIIHRDIKPANLMVTRSGTVKVLDFGVAKVEEPADASRSGAALGTLAYMAPEQLRGEAVQPATDVWSLGCLLQEMVSGAQPFVGETDAALVANIFSGNPRPLDANVPFAVRAVIEKSLQKEPERRYQSAAEFGAAVAGCLNDAPVMEAASRSPRVIAIAVASLVVLGLVAAMAAAYLRRGEEARWAREDALREVTALVEADQYSAAYATAVRAEPFLGDNASLTALWPTIAVTLSMTTEPEGAEVSYKEYTDTGGEWRPVGRTPLKDVRLPRGTIRFRIEKDGYAPAYLARNLTGRLTLEPVILTRGTDDGLVRVPGGSLPVNLSGFNSDSLVSIDEYWIDRSEVTNRSFKAFVDGGGYSNADNWHGLDVRPAVFRDTTGRPGPSTWINSGYPEGRADDPVGGVSWFEAVAYCRFRNEMLPTVQHWARAALAPREITAPLGPAIVPLSNFGGKGPAPVGSHAGMGPYGTFDMAGNVREWTWNAASAGRRWILGGAWSDPSYMFSVPNSLPPEDRSPTNGFRCMRTAAQTNPLTEGAPLPAELLATMEVSSPDYRGVRPVSDETFATFARQLAYIPLAGAAEVVQRETTSAGSVREQVSLDAGYDGERLTIQMFLPADRKGPYQAVVYFPALNAFQSRASSRTYLAADYVVKSGRALVLPVFKGSFERWDNALDATGEQYLRAARQRLLHWRQDLGRTLDYLDARGDIVMDRVAFYGRSFGASMPLPLLALEHRFRTAIFYSGGFTYRTLPPEMDAANYVSRVKMPVLLLSGRHDYVFPYDTSQRPLFELLGTPASEKRHVVFDAGHDPLPRSQVIREILAWLDKYMGPV